MSKNIRIVPCLWFDKASEEAVAFYTSVFPGECRELQRTYYPATPACGQEPDAVCTISFLISGQEFTALDGGPMFKPNPSISFIVHCDSKAQAKKLFLALAEGEAAKVLMEYLEDSPEYPWSKAFGWVQDRFGISWQVFLHPEATSRIMPAIMYTGDQLGKAKEAMQTLTGKVFPEARIDSESLMHSDGGKMVMFAKVFLTGNYEVAMMDSPEDHKFALNEAISLQIVIGNDSTSLQDMQADIDAYTDALAADGGTVGPCGWVKDRFTVWWQIVPHLSCSKWFSHPDSAVRSRVFDAMRSMTKLQVEQLDAVFHGTGDDGATANNSGDDGATAKNSGQ